MRGAEGLDSLREAALLTVRVRDFRRPDQARTRADAAEELGSETTAILV
jgi:hypothetical protein